MNNTRFKIAFFVISCGIRLMPAEWRNKKAINNLIAAKCIKNVKTPTQ